MMDTPELVQASQIMEAIIGSPFEWCPIPGGVVKLADFSQEGGTSGGQYSVGDFLIARYLVTNAQYQSFCDDPEGFRNPRWWEFSPQARQWHVNHPHPRGSAFAGADLPRTRVSWFDSMAFCAWLSMKWVQANSFSTARIIRLPAETEWQRVAVGDTLWDYPWGDTPNPSCANYQNHNGHPTPVYQYTDGQSPFGVLDMAGNVWEWCLTAWGYDNNDLNGYTYRSMRGGAWNTSNPENIGARIRYGHPPRGQLNDAGFRIACVGSF